MGLFFAPVAALVMGSVRPEEQGIASGANNALREVGGALGVAILASVFSAQGGFGTAQSFVDGLEPALWVGAGAVALASVAAFLVPRTRRGTLKTVHGTAETVQETPDTVHAAPETVQATAKTVQGTPSTGPDAPDAPDGGPHPAKDTVTV